MAHLIKNKLFSGGSTDLLRTHTNSPVRSVTAGTTINVLDACLLNGFGEVTLSSLTIDSSGIATATSSNHGYLKIHTVILIAGADQEAINGEWSITDIPNSDEVKFDASESGLTSTTITGATITMKVAPLGWSKPFSDSPNNIAVYQSLNSYSRRNFLRVDDADNLGYTDPGHTYMRGYEYMTSAEDSGSYGFPPKSVLPRGGGFKKCITASPGIYFPSNGINISWTLVGNSNQFYFSTAGAYGYNAGHRANMFFGDLVSYVPGDVGATGLVIDTPGTLGGATDALATTQAYRNYVLP